MALKIRATGGQGVADLAEVRRALAVLADPRLGCQLQRNPFHAESFATFRGDDLDGMAEWVEQHQDALGLYYALNPVASDLDHSLKAVDVIKRRWLLVDVDRDKTQAKDDPATDAEHERARLHTLLVRDCLTAQGWPLPLFVDSGNGWHLLYRIDLPNPPQRANLSQQLVKSVLDALFARFPGPDGVIGTECHDARRISKLPGTWARRGVASAERPYRLARLVELPERVEVVEAELMRDTVAKLMERRTEAPASSEAEAVVDFVPPPPQPSPPPHETNGKGHGKGFKVEATSGPTIDELALAYLNEIPGAVEGTGTGEGSKRTLWAARVICYGFNFGVERGLQFLLDHYNPRCTPPWPEHQLRHKCEDGNSDDYGKPRGWLLEDKGPPIPNGNGSGPESQQAPPPPNTPTIYRLTDLLAMDIPAPRWAVPGLMSEGLTILAGKPKLGKSFLALNLALTIAAGGKALGATNVLAGDVLYLSLEDRLRRVQDRARKLLQGIGCEASSRLHIAIEWPRQGKGGLEAIGAWMESVVRPTLIIIDVWAKFRRTSHNKTSAYDQDYETASEVKSLGDRFNCSVMALHHCKKAAAEDAIDEISGTLGLAGAADGTLILTRARGENEANLFIGGRDIDEGNRALEFSPETCCWVDHGKASERTESRFKAALIVLFKANAGAHMPLSELADALKVPEEQRNSFRQILRRMVDEGLIRRVRQGVYCWPVNTEASW